MAVAQLGKRRAMGLVYSRSKCAHSAASTGWFMASCTDQQYLLSNNGPCRIISRWHWRASLSVGLELAYT